MRVFDEVGENPTTIHVGKGVIAARPFNPDLIIGLGGGSAMDCGKGINFLLTNGGRMQDYWGTDKATKPLLPFVAVPTTAGTGSDAQSYALITDPDTHQKMACGDAKALPRVALLDPELTATQPPKVAAATGIDAVAHAVESAGVDEAQRRLPPAVARSLAAARSALRARDARPRRRRRPRSACSSAPTSPAPRSKTRCSAPPTRWPTRSPASAASSTASPSG